MCIWHDTAINSSKVLLRELHFELTGKIEIQLIMLEIYLYQII